MTHTALLLEAIPHNLVVNTVEFILCLIYGKNIGPQICTCAALIRFTKC